jgi:hypothetical protein
MMMRVTVCEIGRRLRLRIVQFLMRKMSGDFTKEIIIY